MIMVTIVPLLSISLTAQSAPTYYKQPQETLEQEMSVKGFSLISSLFSGSAKSKSWVDSSGYMSSEFPSDFMLIIRALTEADKDIQRQINHISNMDIVEITLVAFCSLISILTILYGCCSAIICKIKIPEVCNNIPQPPPPPKQL